MSLATNAIQFLDMDEPVKGALMEQSMRKRDLRARYNRYRELKSQEASSEKELGRGALANPNAYVSSRKIANDNTTLVREMRKRDGVMARTLESIGVLAGHFVAYTKSQVKQDGLMYRLNQWFYRRQDLHSKRIAGEINDQSDYQTNNTSTGLMGGLLGSAGNAAGSLSVTKEAFLGAGIGAFIPGILKLMMKGVWKLLKKGGGLIGETRIAQFLKGQTAKLTKWILQGLKTVLSPRTWLRVAGNIGRSLMTALETVINPRAIIGALTNGLRFLIKDVLWTALRTLVTGLVEAVGAVLGSELAIPAAVVAAIAALGYVIWEYLIPDDTKQAIMDGLSSFGNAVVQKFEQFWTWLSTDVWEGVKDVFGKSLGLLSNALISVFLGPVGIVWNMLPEKTKASIIDTLSKSFDVLKGKVKDTWLGQKAIGAWNWLSNDVWGATKKSLTSSFDRFKSAFDLTWLGKSATDFWNDEIKGTWDRITGAISNFFSNAWSTMKNWVGFGPSDTPTPSGITSNSTPSDVAPINTPANDNSSSTQSPGMLSRAGNWIKSLFTGSSSSSSGGGDSGGKTYSSNQRVNAAMAFFKQQGWSEAAAAGIVGNLQTESGNFDPSVISGKKRGDNGQAVGIAQWHPDRQALFQRIIGRPLVGSSLGDQLRFVDWELKNGGKYERLAGKMLSRVRTPAEAAAIVDRYYERSSGEARGQRMVNAAKIGGGPLPASASMDPSQDFGAGGEYAGGPSGMGASGGLNPDDLKKYVDMGAKIRKSLNGKGYSSSGTITNAEELSDFLDPGKANTKLPVPYDPRKSPLAAYAMRNKQTDYTATSDYIDVPGLNANDNTNPLMDTSSNDMRFDMTKVESSTKSANSTATPANNSFGPNKAGIANIHQAFEDFGLQALLMEGLKGV